MTQELESVKKVKVMRRKENMNLTKTIQTLNSDHAKSDAGENQNEVQTKVLINKVQLRSRNLRNGFADDGSIKTE